MKKAKAAQSNLFNTPVAPVAPVAERSRSHEATDTKTESLKELSIRLRDEAIKENENTKN